MNISAIDNRYALALMQVCKELNIEFKAIASELQILTNLLKDNPDFKKILLNPSIAKKEKKAIFTLLNQTLKLNEYTFNLALILIDKDRLPSLPSILEIFFEKIAFEKKEAVAQIKTITTLTKEQEDKLKEKLAKLFNKKTITIESEIDPSILGGMIINVGSERIDASIKNSLAQIKNKIAFNN